MFNLKILNPETKEQLRRELNDELRRRYQCKCAACGKTFLAKHTNARYCSGACQSKAWRAAHQPTPPYTCTCEWCGNAFESTFSTSRFCSKLCNSKSIRARKRAAAAPQPADPKVKKGTPYEAYAECL